MSACLILQTPQTIFIGSDSAISTTIENQIYRLSDDGVKLWHIDDKAIFCSGDMELAYKIMKMYIQLADRTIESLKQTVDHFKSLHPDRNVCVIVCHVDETGSSVVYDISAETDYQIIERRMDSGCEGIALWSAGIKTKESVELAESYLHEGYDVLNTYKQVFNAISYEGVGGVLDLKQVSQTEVKDLLFEPISEHAEMKILTEKVYNSLLQPHLIVGERVMGKLLAGQNLIIDASDSSGNKTFTVDGNGVTIAGAKLTITGGIPANQLDPSYKDGLLSLSQAYNGVVIDTGSGLVITKSDGSLRTILNATDGFRFQKKVSGAWSDKFYYDATSGNLVMDGSINARELKINGNNVLVNSGSQISGTTIDKIKIEQLDATTAKIGSALIDTIKTNQIVFGTNGLPDTLITSASTWNGKTTKIDANGIYTGSIYANQITVGGGTIPDSLVGSSSTWNAKETTLGSQAKADAAYNNAVSVANSKDSTLRSDLRLTASLPTQITMNSSGIRASSAAGYAQLDYRGLYVYNGAIQITNPAGTTIMDGNGIYSTTITGSTIQTGYAGTTRMVLDQAGIKSYDNSNNLNGIVISNGNFSFLNYYYQGSDRGGMYQAGGTLFLEPRNGADLVISPNYAYGNITIQAGSGATTKAKGSWDFSGANVTGIVAKFG
jgi:hypothetical protein